MSESGGVPMGIWSLARANCMWWPLEGILKAVAVWFLLLPMGYSPVSPVISSVALIWGGPHCRLLLWRPSWQWRRSDRCLESSMMLAGMEFINGCGLGKDTRPSQWLKGGLIRELRYPLWWSNSCLLQREIVSSGHRAPRLLPTGHGASWEAALFLCGDLVGQTLVLFYSLGSLLISGIILHFMFSFGSSCMEACTLSFRII